jgi:hypothetical protein
LRKKLRGNREIVHPWVVGLLVALTGCSSLSDPRRFYLDCYQRVDLVIETELHEEAYCWVYLTAPHQVCQVGDTHSTYQIDTDRPECFLMPVPPRP